MAVILSKDSEPGDLYIDNHGRISELYSFYTTPSATMKNIVSGGRVGGEERYSRSCFDSSEISARI